MKNLVKTRNGNCSDKFILCRPLGGLNDVLCQVGLSRALGIALRRKVVVQSETASVAPAHRFGHKFEEIFLSNDETLISNPRVLWSYASRDFDTRVQGLAPAISVEKLAELSLSKLTFGRVRELRLGFLEGLRQRSTRILIHESWGGGLRSATALAHLVLVPRLAAMVSSLRAATSSHSVGFHFRNSDLQSDFSILERELHLVPRNSSVLLATDDDDLLERIRSTLPGRKIVSASEILDSVSSGLTSTERAVLELVALSFCETLVLIPIGRTEILGSSQAEQLPRYSGFGRLSKHVWAVNRVKSSGLFSLIRSPRALKGLGAFKNPLSNLIFLVFFELPRIIWQSKRGSGFYAQIATPDHSHSENQKSE